VPRRIIDVGLRNPWDACRQWDGLGPFLDDFAYHSALWTGYPVIPDVPRRHDRGTRVGEGRDGRSPDTVAETGAQTAPVSVEPTGSQRTEARPMEGRS